MNNWNNLGITLRPRTFKDMIGNNTTIKALKNRCVKDDNGNFSNLPHFAIFEGFSGIGKSSSVIILSQLLQCENPIKNEEGYYEPCQECVNCKNVIKGSYASVGIEMYNGREVDIEKAKEIVRNLGNAPMHTKYKVLIIDEGHLMTKDAKTELLTPLETLRDHVYIFITTTDIKKMSESKNRKSKNTILSRLQKFSFNPVPVAEIYSFLGRKVLQELGAINEIPKDIQESFIKEALPTIAKASEGNVRQSLQILSQVLLNKTYTNKEIEEQFGTVSDITLFTFFKSILNKNYTIFSLLDRKDLEDFYYQARSVLIQMRVYKHSEYLKNEWMKGNFDSLKNYDIDTLYSNVFEKYDSAGSPYFNQQLFFHFILEYFNKGNTTNNNTPKSNTTNNNNNNNVRVRTRTKS